jgi:sortase (surface protein transpeptidase)
MRPRTARTLVIASAAVFAMAIGAIAWWPRSAPRADLVEVAAESTTTTTTTTTTSPPTTATSAPTTTTTTLPPMQPGRLRIPALGVDAPVVPVGLNPDGSMEVPPATEVGWYELGVAPGSPQGSAVLAAHVDYGGVRGAFFDLRSLPEGAEVLVSDPVGRVLRYVVDTRLQVDKDDLPVEELFRSGGAPTLTLITCGGEFDRSIRHYEDNIVLRASPAPAPA